MNKGIITKGITVGLAALMLFVGCGGNVDRSAVLVDIEGSDPITMGYGNFFCKFSQANFDMTYGSYYGEDIWSQDMGSNKTYADTYKESLVDNMIDQYLSKVHAADYGIEITGEQQEKIASAAASFMEDNSTKAAKQLGATQEDVVTYLEYMTYYQELRNAIRKETNVSIDDKDANQSTISYVLFSTAPTQDEDGNDVELTDEEKAQLKKDADKLVEASDFEAFAEEAQQTVSKYSYTTAMKPEEDTAMGEAVIKAAQGLLEGEKAVVEVEDRGIYVIRMDKILDQDATATKRESLDAEQRNTHFNEVMDGWKSEIKWTVNESNLGKIKFKNSFTTA